MTLAGKTREIARESVELYWVLVKVVVPVMVLAKLAVDLGLVAATAPLFSPLMTLVGLPPELGLAWATCLLVGIWGGAAAAFTVMPLTELTGAQVSVFSALMLFAHAIPIEHRIMQQAGPSFTVTVLLRMVGTMIYGIILHQLFNATGWLSGPSQPLWSPPAGDPGWATFLVGQVEALFWMYIILVVLIVLMRGMDGIGLTDYLNRWLAPLLGITGIGPKAAPITMVGLLLGVAYGGGLIIRDARRGDIGGRDIFLACVFMGFAHGLIEDTILVLALGADIGSALFGRIAFSMLAMVVIARVVRAMPDRLFFHVCFTHWNTAGAVTGSSHDAKAFEAEQDSRP